jgi:hypothetical protein
MVDTIRTMAALQSLHADNTTGDISPQDNRDVIVSAMTGGHGGIYVANGSTAQTGVTTADTLMTGFATVSGEASGCTENLINDRIDLGRVGLWLVSFHCSFTGAAAVEYTWTLRFNSSLTDYAAVVETADATPRQVSLQGIVRSTAANEAIEMYVKTDQGGGASFTPIHASMMALRIGE